MRLLWITIGCTLLLSACGTNNGKAPDPKYCSTGGVLVKGNCWYLGSNGQSCDSVCVGHGGYNVATSDYAGSNGSSVTQCSGLLDALGVPAGTISNSNSCAFGYGCMYFNNAGGVRTYCSAPATDSTSTQSSTERVCSCNK